MLLHQKVEQQSRIDQKAFGLKVLSPLIIGETWQKPLRLHNKTSKGLHLLYIAAG